MKIITSDSVYVQKSDITYLLKCDESIPVSIFNKVYNDNIFYVNESNKCDFIRFYLPNEIDFFKSMDWIIDYYDIKDLSEQDIMELGQKISEQRNEIAKKFNSMSKIDKELNMNLIMQHELLENKLFSLRDFLLLKHGKLKMELPQDVEYPTIQKNNIKTFIKTLFRNKRK